MFDGKSVAANHALYLLTMPANPENKEVVSNAVVGWIVVFGFCRSWNT